MIIIGEKLNGFIPSVGKAIRARDEAFLRDLAIRQEEAGADYLDVCAAVDAEVEAETLLWLAQLAEDASSLPLCIDSPNPNVLAAVLPHCKRAGIVKSRRSAALCPSPETPPGILPGTPIGSNPR